MQFKRKQRVEELIKVNLSNIIQRDVSRRLPGMATIMHVELSDDLKYAKVKVSVFGSDEAKKKSFGILNKELKNIRKRLGRILSLRNNPILTFVEDTSLDNAFRIDELLAKIHQNDKNPGQTNDQNT